MMRQAIVIRYVIDQCSACFNSVSDDDHRRWKSLKPTQGTVTHFLMDDAVNAAMTTSHQRLKQTQRGGRPFKRFTLLVPSMITTCRKNELQPQFHVRFPSCFFALCLCK